MQKETFICIDYKIFNNLTRKQVAFLVYINGLNKAGFVATNKEISAALGITPTYVSKIIKNINKKLPNTLKKKHVSVNKNGKIKKDSEDERFREVRSILLLKPLHTKGETFIKLDSWIYEKRSTFLSSNELRVLGYFKSMPKSQFIGYLKTLSKKIALSLSQIKKALKTLIKLGFIKRRITTQLSRIKRLFYTISTFTVVKIPKYENNSVDQNKLIKKKEEDVDPNSNLKNIFKELTEAF